MKLERDFYLRSGLEVAPELIGKQLVHITPAGITKGIIVEVEAYMGHEDAAAHSYKSRFTPRTAIQFGIGGFTYVYSIYGLHVCMNVVVNRENCPEVVLVRALEPTYGINLMCRRRGREALLELCSGPGKLCQAMDISKADYGTDLCGDDLYIESVDIDQPTVVATKRINIDYSGKAADYYWRYIWKGNPYVSVSPRV